MPWSKWNGPKVKAAVVQAVSRAGIKTAEIVGGVADQQVPLDEGTLLNSKTIKADPSNPQNVQIGYGGGGDTGYPLVPYAIRWHEEDANFQHGRKKNYLRDPIKSVAPRAYKKALQQELKNL